MSNARAAAADTIEYSKAAARAARNSGLRGAFGSILGGVSQLGWGSYSVWGK